MLCVSSELNAKDLNIATSKKMKDWPVSKHIFVPVLSGTELISFTEVDMGLFCICAQNNIDKYKYSAIAEQGLHKANAFLLWELY